MNSLAKSVALACLVAATGGAVQGMGAQPVTPSSVNDSVPAVPPLAGTLFFAQQQREQMDSARWRGAGSVQESWERTAPSVLDGFVKRSDGSSTVWVDGVQKLMSDARIIARVQSTSVGMETTTIIAGQQTREPSASERTRAKAPAKSRKAVRKHGSASAPLRK
ncbi:MAG: hypothetical protein ABI790_00360 [Betaproteobacteria bacterium]